MEWNYLSIPKLERCSRWSLDKLFNLTMYHWYTYLPSQSEPVNNQTMTNINAINTIGTFCSGTANNGFNDEDAVSPFFSNTTVKGLRVKWSNIFVVYSQKTSYDQVLWSLATAKCALVVYKSLTNLSLSKMLWNFKLKIFFQFGIYVNDISPLT